MLGGTRWWRWDPPGMTFTVRFSLVPKRREGTSESLKGALSWEEPGLSGRSDGCELQLEGLLRVACKESMPEQVGEGTQARKGPRQARLVCSSHPWLSGALCSTPLHVAQLAEETGVQRVPWPVGSTDRRTCSPHTGSNLYGSFLPRTQF